jgi:hypothetical protein
VRLNRTRQFRAVVYLFVTSIVNRGASENPLGTKIKTATMSTETNCTSTHDKDMCSPGSVTDNSESERDQSNLLKFGIANILRESEQSSVTVQNSHKVTVQNRSHISYKF